MSADDEITMKEAADTQAVRDHPLHARFDPADDPEMVAERRRLRAEAETSAQLDAMLTASRRGKVVRK
jgi:hypothetical protein